jgi:hypothetical protein
MNSAVQSLRISHHVAAFVNGAVNLLNDSLRLLGEFTTTGEVSSAIYAANNS